MSLGRHINSPTKTSSNLYCSVCNLQFFIRDLTLRKSKCPLLLFCGHAVCGSCLWQKAKISNTILCRQCGFHSTLRSTEYFNETFPLDKYLTGSIIEFHSTKYRLDRRVLFNHDLKQDSKPLLKSKSIECDECSMTPASWYCDICRSNYCEKCWLKIHSTAKSLMKHVKHAVISNQHKGNDALLCPKHETQKLEFYCKVCQCVVCSHCVILEHQGDGHCSITIKEKNSEMIKKIKIAARDADTISKKMRRTLEEIRLRYSNEVLGKQSYLALEKEISLKFAHLHGVLQMEELRLVTLLGESTRRRLDLLDGLNARLNAYLENTGNLLGESDAFLQNPENWNRDVTNLYQKLLAVKTLPVHLIPQAKDHINVKLKFDESVIGALRRFCNLELQKNEEIYELVSDEKFLIGSCEDGFYFQDQKIGQKQEDNYSGEDLPITELCEDTAIKLNEGKRYLVHLCYLKDPSEFYVTLNSQEVVRKVIEQKMEHMDFCPLFPEAVIKDELYIVKSGTDEKLRRARALNRLPEDSPRGPSATVYYLDFGNSEIVPISRMSSLSEDLKKIPPLAMKCKLSGCVPVDGEWCAESVNVVERILDKSIITMLVIKINQDCMEVDLGIVGGETHIAMDFESVRDALLFFELATLTGGPRRIQTPKLLNYLSQSLPSRGETFAVAITHANSPDDFYVQRAQHDYSYENKLFIDMQTYYNLNPQKGTVYNPTIGMPCAAFHSEEQKWYRAQIIVIPVKNMVTVFYVDYGNIETIPWTSIRKLKGVFFRSPPLAFNCSLAGIQPKLGQWDSTAKSYMMSLVDEMDLRIFVHGSRPCRGSGNLKVSLYEKHDKKEICVNTSLVRLDLAISINPRFISGTGVIPRSSRIQGSKRPEKTKSKPTASELRALHAANRENSSGVASATEVKSSVIEVNKSDGDFKVKVQVLSAESPSSIYVAFPAAGETLCKLKAQMVEFYEKTSAEDGKQWEVGSKCAVFYSEKNSWFRASVLALLPDKMIKLFLLDVAIVSTACASSLRELDPLFAHYPNCAFKCNLADVAPVGEEWPSVSCEFFSMELEKYSDVYITRRGDIENKSLPVELWVEKVESQGALEPVKKQWITLNEVLVREGLAVPLKAYMEFPEAFSKEKPSTSHHSENGSEAEEAAQDLLAVAPVFEPKWLPPQPLRCSRFIGRPTYVDLDGSIYIHDVDKDGGTLKWIRETLTEDSQNSDDVPDDRIWCPQQLCIARFHLDQFWYRGLVLKANEDFTYEVLFVDYGNVETCRASDLRDTTKMIEIPVLTHKFCLRDIAPVSKDGKWTLEVLQILHSLVVDRMCEVNVFFESPDPSQPSIISLKVTEGEEEFDVGLHLIKEGLGQLKPAVDYNDNSDVPDDAIPPNVPLPVIDPPVINMIEQRDVAVKVDGPRYLSLRIPEEIHGLFVKVIIPFSKMVTTNLVDNESLPLELRRIVQDFELLKEELAEDCPTQPALETFSPGQPCCCLDPALGEWCRAEVETFWPLNDTVDVTLVDTGFQEVMDRNSVLECKPEWLRVPKMAVTFKLAPEMTDWRDVFSQDYQDHVFYARILDRHEKFFEGTLSKVDEFNKH